MFRMFIAPAVVVAVFALMGGQAHAAEDGRTHDGHAAHQKSDDVKRVGDPYPLKVDPVGDSLFDVDKTIVIVHDGRELRFASEENLKKFNADPEKYLAEVDQKIIAQQNPLYRLQTCVVSGEKLGEMGEPTDIVHGNRLVRFCCKGCVGMFKKDPAKHLAKIDAAVIEAQKADYPLDTCVVSGEKLGGEMGEPIDYVIGNRLVRFCCKGCVKMFEKNPAKHLAKLDAHGTHGDQHEEGGKHGDHHENHADHGEGKGHEHHGHDH